MSHVKSVRLSAASSNGRSRLMQCRVPRNNGPLLKFSKQRVEKQRVSPGAGTGAILSWECAQKVSWPKNILFVQLSESGVGFG